MSKPLQISNTGITVTSGPASAANAIPTTGAGRTPTHVRVAVTAPAHIKFGPSGVTATTNDALLVPGEPECFAVTGQTHFAVIEQTAGAKVNVVPVY